MTSEPPITATLTWLATVGLGSNMRTAPLPIGIAVLL
jgi:hypothetical protein